MIGKAIYNLLSNNLAVSSIVGTRIYQDMPPQDVAFPFVVYTILSTIPTNTKDVNTRSVLDAQVVQLDMYSKKVVESNNLAEAVRARLDGFEGTVAGLTIKQCRFTGDTSAAEDLELGVYFRSQDYEFHIHKTY